MQMVWGPFMILERTNVNVANDSLCTPMLMTTLYDHTDMVGKLRSLDVELDVY